MKPITTAQWEKASPSTRSWLVCQAFGFKHTVFWHASRDGTYAGNVGGSHRDKATAEAHLEAYKERFPHLGFTDQARVRRDLAFPHCASIDNAALAVLEELRKQKMHVVLNLEPDGWVSSEIYLGKGRTRGWGYAESFAEAICQSAMRKKGLLYK